MFGVGFAIAGTMSRIVRAPVGTRFVRLTGADGTSRKIKMTAADGSARTIAARV